VPQNGPTSVFSRETMSFVGEMSYMVLLEGVNKQTMEEKGEKRKYHVRRRQVRSFGGHDSRINDRISGGKEVKRGKYMAGPEFLFDKIGNIGESLQLRRSSFNSGLKFKSTFEAIEAT